MSIKYTIKFICNHLADTFAQSDFSFKLMVWLTQHPRTQQCQGNNWIKTHNLRIK